MSKGPVVTIEKTLPVSVSEVWQLVSDPTLWGPMFIPHTYTPFDIQSPQVGSMCYCQMIGAPKDYPRYVTQCEYGRVLAIGTKPKEWHFKWEFQEMGIRTWMAFSREFRKPDILERLQPNKFREGLRSLTEETAQRLERACENIAAGQEHGLRGM